MVLPALTMAVAAPMGTTCFTFGTARSWALSRGKSSSGVSTESLPSTFPYTSSGSFERAPYTCRWPVMLPTTLLLKDSSRVEKSEPPTTSSAAPKASTEPTKTLRKLETMFASEMRTRTNSRESIDAPRKGGLRG